MTQNSSVHQSLARPVLSVIAALLALAPAQGVMAGDVLNHVRRDHVVRCMAEESQAVAMPRPDGGIDGLAVDLCRAVAIAVLGREGRVAFTTNAPTQDADVVFIASEDEAAHRRFAPGPTVFVDRLSVLVPLASRVHAIPNLAGETVCLMIGSPGQSALEAMVRHLGIDITRLAFEEDAEMWDAYAVERCGAMVGTLTTLSGLRGPMGINRLTSRVLPEALALVPVIAATAATDREWAAIVSWVVHERVGDVPDALPWPRTNMPPAGVTRGWREDVGAVLGGGKALSRGASDGDSGDSRTDASKRF